LLDVGLGTQTVGNFWLRRWFRTLPNYYLFLAVNVMLYAFVLRRPIGDASYLIFAHALATPFSSAFFGESWSLAVEEWFYLLAPLLLVAAARVVPRTDAKFTVLSVMIAIIIGSAIARIVGAHQIDASIDSTLRKIVVFRLDSLAVGVVLAWLERYRQDLFARASRLAWAGALGILVASGYLGLLTNALAFLAPAAGIDQWLAPLLFSLLPLSAALLLAGVANAQIRERAWIDLHSRWAYSMYLLHLPLVHLLLHVSGGFANPFFFAAIFIAWYAATLIGAAAIYRFYERPIMNMRERFAPRGADSSTR
jgi:peptidoglycan/LPS O-acetylase OafA/YrhL